MTRGAKGSRGGYCELIASATSASTMNVPKVFTRRHVSKSSILSLIRPVQSLCGFAAAQCTAPASEPSGMTAIAASMAACTFSLLVMSVCW